MPQTELQATLPALPQVQSFSVGASWVFKSDGLRLDASFYNPGVARAIEAIRRSGMEVKTLGEATERIFIPPRFKRIYVGRDHGVPFLQGRHLPQFQPTDVKYLSRLAQKRLEVWIIKAGWVLVTCSGTIGRVTIAPKQWGEWAASQHIMRIVPRADSGCPAGYLYAFLSSPEGQAQLTSTIYGAVVDEITEAHARSILIPVPSVPEHEARVAAINKIALQSIEQRTVAVTLAEKSVAAFDDLLHEEDDVLPMVAEPPARRVPKSE